MQYVGKNVLSIVRQPAMVFPLLQKWNGASMCVPECVEKVIALVLALSPFSVNRRVWMIGTGVFG